MFMELHRGEKREEGDRGGQEDKKVESKGERQIQPVICSLSVLHSLEHTNRFMELGREEKGINLICIVNIFSSMLFFKPKYS